jgi:hypothetical protein
MQGKVGEEYINLSQDRSKRVIGTRHVEELCFFRFKR